ncbi:MAG: tetratricopeptide repeat protein [Myxococcales bacterium]|nr:tetratricopeptide repeat protein [Myxococcales bacterium]
MYQRLGVLRRCVALWTLACLWLAAPAVAMAQAPASDAPAAPTVPKLDPSLCQIETRPVVEGQQDKAAKKKARVHLAAARKAYEGYQFVDALRELRSAYEIDPQNDVLFNIAQTCREGGADAEALKLYEFIVRQNPDPALKADSERHIGTLRGKLAKALDEKALDQMKGEHYDVAAKLWDQAHKLDPQPLFLFRQGNALRLSGDSGEALVVFERFVATNPSEDMMKEARSHMARLRSKQSVERAKNHLRAEEYAQAMAAWQAAYEQDPRELYIFEIADAARKAGLTNESVASYQRFLRETQPTDYVEQRRQAEAQLPVLRKQLEAKKAAEKPIYKRWWFWTALGAGVAVAVTAGVVGVVASEPVNFLSDIPADRQRPLNPPP